MRSTINNSFSKLFGIIGEGAVKFHYIYILLGISLVIGLSIGFTQLEEEDDLFYTVQIPNSETEDERIEYNDDFGGITRLQQIVVESGSDMLTVEGLNAYLDVLTEVSALIPTAVSINVDGEPQFWHDFCERPPVPASLLPGSPVWQLLNATLIQLAPLGVQPLPPGFGIWRFPCVRRTVMDCFKEGSYDYPAELQLVEAIQQMLGYPESLSALRFPGYASKPSFRDPNVDIAEVVTVGFDRNIAGLPSNCTDWAGIPIEPQSVLQRSIARDSNNIFVNVRRVRTVFRNFDPEHYLFKKNHPTWDKNTRKDAVLDMEKAFIDYCDVFYERDVGSGFHSGEVNALFSVDYFAWRSKDDIWTDISEASAHLIIIGYVLMLLYVLCVVGIRWSCSRCGIYTLVQSRTMLCLAGVCVVALAAISSFGFLGYVGIPQTVWSNQVAPFVALGLGIDDMFVILENFRQSQTDQSLTKRMHQAFSLAGPSITLTSLANFSVFLIASIWSMRSIQWFSYQMACNVMLNYLFLILLFVPLMGYDARRIAASRFDWIFCASTDQSDEDETSNETSGRIWMKIFAPTLRNILGLIVVLVIFSTLFGIAIWGVTETEVNTAPSDLSLEGSYQEDFMFLIEDHFATADPVVVIRTIDYPARQSDLIDMINSIEQSIWLSDSSPLLQLFWYNRFRAFVASPETPFSVDPITQLIPEPLFYPAFKAWIVTSGVASQLDLICMYPDDYQGDRENEQDCTLPETIIKTTRTTTLLHNLFDTEDNIDAIEDIRDRTDAGMPNDDAYNTGFIYLWYDSHADLEQDTLNTCGTALGVIVFIVLIFQLSPIIALLVGSVICMTIVEVAGYSALFGLDLSTWAFTNIVISISYSVEFTVHISRAFLVAQGSRKRRTLIALSELTGPMLNGFCSSFIATVPMAFANVQLIVEYYFGMFTLMLVIAFLNGMFLLPMLLAYIGPTDLPEPGDAQDIDIPDSVTKELEDFSEENDASKFCI